MALIVAGQQTRTVALSAVEVADHVDRVRFGRPHAESGAVGYQVGAHGSVRENVFKRCWHGELYSVRLPDTIPEIPLCTRHPGYHRRSRQIFRIKSIT
jgi:hypothetical protein